VSGWVAGKWGDVDGEPVPCADDGDLGDGILFEEFGYEIGCVAEGEEVAGGT